MPTRPEPKSNSDPGIGAAGVSVVQGQKARLSMVRKPDAPKAGRGIDQVGAESHLSDAISAEDDPPVTRKIV